MADRTLRVGVVVMEDCTPMVPIGVADLFRKLEMLPEYTNDPKARAVEVRFVGAHRRVRTAGGVPIACDVTFGDREHFDLAVVGALDPEIDKYMAHVNLPPKFVIPGGNRLSAQLDVARTIVRRAERAVVRIQLADELASTEILRFLNRASDLVFSMARYADVDFPDLFEGRRKSGEDEE